MVAQFSVKGDVQAVLRDLNRVQRRFVPKAASQALNRARTRATTRIVRAVSSRTNIQQKLIRQRVGFKPATPRLLITELIGHWKPFPIIRLGRARETKTGVTVRGQKIPGGFIARMRSGHRGVLKRVDDPRLPIKQEKESIFTEADRVATVLIKRVALPEFRREFNRNLRRLLR